MPNDKQSLAFESLQILLSPQEVKILVEALEIYSNPAFLDLIGKPLAGEPFIQFVRDLGHYLQGELALFTQEHEARWNAEREMKALPSQPHPVSAATDILPPVCHKLPTLFEAAAQITGAKDGEE